LPVHAGAIFLGAFLLFQVQPIVAKAILPWFGGASSVWTTCMLFFQSLLLAGYGYAHASTRLLGPRAQGLVHLFLLAAALVLLPIVPDSRWVPSGTGSPILAILSVLARCVAVPYILLSATSPLFQAWAAKNASGPAPYRLYALSNVGSMLALLSYPVLIEPWLSTRQQEIGWSFAFGLFALVCAGCVLRLWRSADTPEAAAPADLPSAAPPDRRAWLLWLVLPACAAVLLLAVTNQMCQEVAVVPFLWIVPLSLYLLSFIVTFESDRWYARSWCLPVLVLTLIVLGTACAMGARVGILYGVPVYSAGLFVACMFCHGELAALRPGPRHLTAFYLMIALGGALGGLFVTLVAPLLFRGFDELYVGLIALGSLAAWFSFSDPAYRMAGHRAWNPFLPALIVVVLLIGVLFGGRLLQRTQPGLTELRSFYGTLRILDTPAPDESGMMRLLTHGSTRHGQQFLDAERRGTPTTYFSSQSGIGKLLAELSEAPPRRMGIVGLGAGVLAAYGRPGDTIRFYELSPQVIDVARSYFTFLKDSPATIETVAGDARLSLEREEREPPLDVLVVDAFSSDAIPVHLLTREAFQLYFRRLRPGGVLALHLTTRHLDLGPQVAALARAVGKSAWEIETPADDRRGIMDAKWILVTADGALLGRPRLRDAGHPPGAGAAPPRLWTDDYSNLFQVLK
jgi:hypothetical protein